MTGNIEVKRYGQLLIPFFLAVALTACSTANQESMGTFDSETGSHLAGFVSSHPRAVSSDAGECTPCHSDFLDGGISKVSCLTSACHHDAIPSWASPLEHGASAKSASISLGFISCQICHGKDFSGGLSGMDCFLCHTTAPHPSNWRTGDPSVHTSAAEENGPACAECHIDGNNSPIPPPPAPAPGTPPGCFNNTLCHGDVLGGTHATNWLNSDAVSSFHGTFVPVMTCETSGCHQVSGHPSCTSCHFDNQGSRNNPSIGFTHGSNVFNTHRSGSFVPAGNICENCHQTSRTFRGGTPSCSAGGGSHPGNDGCHYDAGLLDPVLTNPRY